MPNQIMQYKLFLEYLESKAASVTGYNSQTFLKIGKIKFLNHQFIIGKTWLKWGYKSWSVICTAKSKWACTLQPVGTNWSSKTSLQCVAGAFSEWWGLFAFLICELSMLCQYSVLVQQMTDTLLLAGDIISISNISLTC